MEWSLLNPATIVIAVCFVLLGWYFVGGQWNRRRRQSLVRGLAAEFASLHPRPKVQWLGTSAFQIIATSPPDPFRQLTVVVTLEPREMLLVWVVGRLRGRRDLLVVRGDLQREPRREFEAFDVSTPTGRKGFQAAMVARWVVAESQGASRLRWAYGPGQADPRSRWAGLLGNLPFRPHYVSVRRSSPHLHLSLAAPPGQMPGDSLLKSVVAIGEEAVR